jgi:hypothetical protein
LGEVVKGDDVPCLTYSESSLLMVSQFVSLKAVLLSPWGIVIFAWSSNWWTMLPAE